MISDVCAEDALMAATREVFETMIFMDVHAASEPNKTVEGDTLLGSITFKGSVDGCLSFCCGTNCAETIAANMLGMDGPEEISEEETCDAIGEVVNMIMGNMKSHLRDSLGEVQVSIPTVVSGRGLQNTLGEGACKVLVKTMFQDEYIAELWLLYRKNHY